MMQEPIWDTDEKHKGLRPVKGDLVWVVSKTRGRFGALEVADIGAHGIVISSWTSASFGTPKICILCHDGVERATTASCARTYSTLIDYSERVRSGGSDRHRGEPAWETVYYAWMNDTYVPIIVQREKGFGRARWAQTRDKSAYLVKPINTRGKMWLNRDKVHPDDWETMLKSDSVCVSVRVPVWVARKGGLFTDDAKGK
jgi:hypothetical protein